MSDTTAKRKERLQALRAKAEENPQAEARRGGGRRGGGRAAGGRKGAGNFRSIVLKMLKNVEEGDSVVEGTEVGQKQLEKLMSFIDKKESEGRGNQMKEKITEVLSPVETDEGFQFNAEGVNKLIELLEQEPKQGGGRAGMAGRGRGRGRGQGQGQGRGMGQRRGRQQAQGEGGGQLRKTIEELVKKVDALTKTAES